MQIYNGHWNGTRMHHAEHETAEDAFPAADIGHHTHGTHAHVHTHANTKNVLNRLSRAIGHMNGIRTMVEEGRDCSEVLIQLAAVRSAINGICKVILQDHLDHCIVDAIASGDTETMEELNKAIQMLLK